MQILWKGHSCFQILASKGKPARPGQEQVKIVIDPYDEAVGLKLGTLEADILLMTHDHHDHNNEKAVKGPPGQGTPFIIGNPGEYEVQGIFIKGISSFHDDSEGKERGLNTIYVLEAEGIKLCHLGDIGQKELTAEQLEAIGDVDVLFLPVGGVYTIAAKEAANIIGQLEPKIAIPMHYALPGSKVKIGGVEEFLKIMGAKSVVPQEKLVLKTKDLVEEETKIVVLEP